MSENDVNKAMLSLCGEAIRCARSALSAASNRAMTDYAIGHIDGVAKVLNKLIELQEGDDHDDSA